MNFNLIYLNNCKEIKFKLLILREVFLKKTKANKLNIKIKKYKFYI